MTRYLIVNADDFGYPGTVDGIAELFEVGIVTSASVMVNQPEWPQAAALLREHPEWDAGVHLVMNDGSPILPAQQVRSLVDGGGQFRSGMALLSRRPLTSQRQLKAEWEAQIEKFIADTGRQPSHFDLHCHYPYVFPAWFRLSLDLAEKYGRIPVRTPFDDALEEKASELASHYGGFPVWFILWQGRRYREMVDRHGLARTNYWEGGFSQDGRRTVEVLVGILENLPEGVTELLCHPAKEDGWRREDYDVLADRRVRERIDALGIELIDYRDLARLRRDGD
jgi:predicted glycoside hydrolase/deacetylase ChbG (UPF0249 family)